MARAIITVGLGFGDEGKGSVVDYLCRIHDSKLVVRYSGGHQAAHNVVTPGGIHHCFAQFGAGTLAGADTHLHRNMMIEPFALYYEAQHLKKIGVYDPFGVLTIDPSCLVTTPYHRAANRRRELRDRHGSCGVGIGETRQYHLQHGEDSLFAGDLLKLGAVIDKLSIMQQRYGLEGEEFSPSRIAMDMCRMAPKDSIGDVPNVEGTVIFEGAQGVLLDEWKGFHPHTTWSTVTADAADAAMRDLGISECETMGIIRAFHTRHGAGPLPFAHERKLPGEHNGLHEWQGQFRVSGFHWPLFQYAIDNLGKPLDSLALTWMDIAETSDYRYNVSLKTGDLAQQEKLTWDLMLLSYASQCHMTTEALCDQIKAVVGDAAILKSYGPTCKDKIV